MSRIVIIAAVGRKGELGKHNDLIWHLPNDLKFFKENTMGKPIVMGYNTFLSLPKVLPGRKHLVLVQDKVEFPEGVQAFYDKESLLDEIDKYDGEVFVIGGASMFRQFLEYADRLLLTEIEAEDSEADVYFPEFDKSKYTCNFIKENEDNGIKYKHVEYIKKN